MEGNSSLQAEEIRSYCPMCNSVFRTPFSRCPLDGTKLAELSSDPLIGTILDKRYIVEECIGEGGMGRVYRAKHTRMSRHYAIKILFGDHAGDTRMRSRFAREAEAVSRLSHPNVISVVDFGETEEGLLYLVMDLAKGASLADVVHKEAPFEATRAVEILARLARGLAHAHHHGLVHRDFKCENVIMVEEEGIETPKIVDFGICMIIEDTPAATMLTSNGMIMGTPAVMAPEQASGDKVDHRTDLFSLGIVGYQMLSGCLPFEGSPLDMARKNLYEEIPSIAVRSGVHVAPELEAIIHKLTAKSPGQRFQNAKEVLGALQGLAIPCQFDAWTVTTPMPLASDATQREISQLQPVVGSGMQPVVGSGMQPVVGSGMQPVVGTDATQMVTPLGPRSVSVAETLPPHTKRSSRAILFAIAAIVLAGGFGMYALETGDSSSDVERSGPAVVAMPAANAGEAAPKNDVEKLHGIDAGATDGTTLEAISRNGTDKPASTGTLDGADAGPELKALPQKTGKPTRSKRAKRHARKRVEARKAPPNKNDDQAALLKKTKTLYQSVARSLDALEKSKGKHTVSDLRKDYNQISYSRLSRDKSMQPIYYQSLVRLRAQIVARRKK